MFGNLGAFVNGNMFLGLFGADVGVKLAPADGDELAKAEGAGPFGPTERPMGGYLTLPRSLWGTAEGDRWISRSLDSETVALRALWAPSRPRRTVWATRVCPAA